MPDALPHSLPHPLRLRQICLAAPRLEPVLDDLQAILGIEVCHRDPNLQRYGLENALLPVGSDFIEVVSPIQAETAAGRFIQRSRGHGGYMAIFQCDEPRHHQALATALGVRTAHEIDHPGYRSVQLHPRDCRAAFIELGRSDGAEPRMGAWWPAGAHWQAHVRTQRTRRLLGIELEAPDAAGLARLWAGLLDVAPDRTPGGDGRAPGATLALQIEQASITFVPGAEAALSTLMLEVSDLGATLARAIDRGLRVQHDAFHLAGVYFRLSQAEAR